jgi:hypothetical protein
MQWFLVAAPSEIVRCAVLYKTEARMKYSAFRAALASCLMLVMSVVTFSVHADCVRLREVPSAWDAAACPSLKERFLREMDRHLLLDTESGLTFDYGAPGGVCPRLRGIGGSETRMVPDALSTDTDDDMPLLPRRFGAEEERFCWPRMKPGEE